jgi:hypothetical protein
MIYKIELKKVANVTSITCRITRDAIRIIWYWPKEHAARTMQLINHKPMKESAFQELAARFMTSGNNIPQLEAG